ncbi:unknown protein [Seminavis robusta]|uniref:G-protein coupled receptors family 2 profile 2 domain-containing protein n=1 Tax=Seminavis robusta TaxID=568900 RepID=A0A9N8EQ76_9STRA|nr:unknown protein [Seminavis robusta]|eukprot:Sro1583_g284010.1 n/a (331) ;mRNA; f:25089-26081
MDNEDISFLSETQDLIQCITSIIPCLLNIWRSGNIIYMILSCKKRTAYRRILMGLSVGDLIVTVLIPLQSTLSPSETSQRAWAIGTDETCSAVGFFQQLSFMNAIYCAMLSLYFLLTVRQGVREMIMARRYEPWIHLLAIGYPLVTAVIGAILGVYHEVTLGYGCWVANYPPGCGCREDDNGECCLSPMIAWMFGGLPNVPVLGFITVVISNVLVYCHVRATIHRSSRYNRATQAKNPTTKRISFSLRRTSTDSSIHEAQAQRIQMVASQAFLYASQLITLLRSAMLRNMAALDYDAEDEASLFPLMLLGPSFSHCKAFSIGLFLFDHPT